MGQDPVAVKLHPALTEPMRIPEINYHDVKLTGSAYEKNLMRQLSFFSLM